MKTSSRLLIAVGTIFLAVAIVSGWSLTVSTALAEKVNPAIAPQQPAHAAQAPNLDLQISVETVIASGLAQPVQVTHAGDGSGRLFILEQTGKIRILQNGTLLPTPFLDISTKISCCGERGLLGLAFHPNYKSNGLFFLNYTRQGDGATVIERYQVSGDPNLAAPASAQTLLVIPQPYANHNGGQIAFGPDGMLYIGTGDGGSGGDPQNYAQNIDSLLGKMLRIDVNQGNPYAIPAGNPFIGKPGRDEIWALGLRNPWRWSFDRLTGDLYIGDVGQNLWEEIDFQPAGVGGLNYGWRCYEGTHVYNLSPPCPGPLTPPILEYDHSTGQSVTGGFVYRGITFPNLYGIYFYADFSQGKIWGASQSGGQWTTALLLDTPYTFSAFGEDEAGELYLCDYYGGKIRRLIDSRGGTPDLSGSKKTASSLYANAGEVITYTIRLENTGTAPANQVQVTDTLPTGLSYLPGSLQATSGAWDDSGSPVLRWSGSLPPSSQTLITYRAQVLPGGGNRVNQAQVSGIGFQPLTLTYALLTPRPRLNTTLEDFVLPGTQPNVISDPILLPVTCDVCHTSPIYDAWRGSLMSQAGRDPLLWAALEIANRDAPGAGEYCLRCHTPKGWLEGRSRPADGSALLPADVESGVSCAVCHRAVEPEPVSDPPDEASSYDQIVRAALALKPPLSHVGSSMLIIDPLDNRRGPFSLGITFAAHPRNTYQTDYLGRQQADAVTRSRLCGSCHNVENPVLSWDPARQQYWLNGDNLRAPSFEKGDLFPVETTFDEWLNSQYATSGVYAPQFAGAKADGMVSACQDCHMPRSRGIAAEPAFNPVNRDCQTTGCLPVHEFVGGNSWTPRLLLDPRWRLSAPDEAPFLTASAEAAQRMLRRSATLTLTLESAQGQKQATVRIYNQSGHKLPTGYAEGRRMWLNLKAYDANGNLLVEYGQYDPLSGSLTATPQVKVYEIKQGITPELASLLGMPAGESFHFVLNNTVIKDNRIPPRGFTAQALATRGLQPVGASYAPGQYWDDTQYLLPAETYSVVATLYYQTASKEYIDFLRTNGGVDAFTLGELWDTIKSPPEVVAVDIYPKNELWFPLIGR